MTDYNKGASDYFVRFARKGIVNGVDFYTDQKIDLGEEVRDTASIL